MNNTQAGRIELEEKLGPKSRSGAQTRPLKFFKDEKSKGKSWGESCFLVLPSSYLKTASTTDEPLIHCMDS